MPEIFDPPGLPPFDPKDRYSQYMRLPLSARPFQWLQRAYSKDYTYSNTPSPEMIPIAGHKDTSMYDLIPVCKMVARVVTNDPDVSLDWAYVADWLQVGGTPQLICDTIRAQIRQMGDRFTGVRTLRLFDVSVRAAIHRTRSER